MIEAKINKENLIKFLKNIRYKDKIELEIFLGKKYREEFIKTTLKNKNTTWMLQDKNNNPIAIGGVVFHCFDGLKGGQIWLLCSNDVNKHKHYLFKYIKNKLDIFKNEFDILFNYIYKSNFKILLWLKVLGFCQEYLKNNDFRFFYYKKEGVDFDIRRFTC